MRLVILAILIFAAYSAYNQFFAKHKEVNEEAYLSPELQDAVYKGRADIDAIRSGISRDHKRNALSGKAPYPVTLTKESTHLFGNVLITPIMPGSGWEQTASNSYTYTFGPGQSADFEYNPQNGEFGCVNSYEVCRFFE